MTTFKKLIDEIELEINTSLYNDRNGNFKLPKSLLIVEYKKITRATAKLKELMFGIKEKKWLITMGLLSK